MAKKKTGEEMEVRQQTLPEIPDYIDAASSDGKDNLNAGEDTIIPRLCIVHGTSKASTAFGVPVGHFSTNLYNEDLGTEVELVILQVAPGYLVFASQDEGGGLISRKFKDDVIPPVEEAIAMDPQNQKWGKEDIIDHRTHQKTGEKDVKPVSGKAYLYIAVLNGNIPVALTLLSTAVAVARKLNSQLLSTKGPIYALKYKVTVMEKSNDSNTWYQPNFEPAGWVSEEEMKKYAAFFGQFKMKKKDVIIEDEPAGAKADTTETSSAF